MQVCTVVCGDQGEAQREHRELVRVVIRQRSAGRLFERAVLRHRLRVQRQEIRQVAAWAEARTSELGDRSITLGDESDVRDPALAVRPSGGGDGALRELLTRRELEVLEMMVRGETNGGIARELVLSEGTVKFHVKNILRKLHASNRAEATSRYLRLTLNQSDRRETT
jgi:DNA-binding NarL/FixJ family response regulator